MPIIEARRERAFRWGLVLTLMVGTTISVQPILFPTTVQQHQRRLVSALMLRERTPLGRHAEELATLDPESPFSIAVAAEAAAFLSQNETATTLFRKLPHDGGRWEFLAERGLARRAMTQGRLRQAEQHWRRALELSPHDLECLEGLGHLLQVEGRTWEAAPYFFTQILLGKCRGDELLGAAANDRFFRADAHLEHQSDLLPTPEPLMQLAAARRYSMDSDVTRAEPLYRTVLRAVPESGEAQGRYGRLIVDRGNLAEFLHWRGSLPDTARGHPEVWYVQGMFARQSGQIEGAARCFLEALAVAPNHVGATLQATSCLQQLGKVEAAEALRLRGELLSELEALLTLVREEGELASYEKIVHILQSLGRHWEAAGWGYVMHYLPIDKLIATNHMRRNLAIVRGKWEPQAAAVLPSQLVDRREFALPQWPLGPEPTESAPSSTSASIAWQFRDDAAALGIDMNYFEGTTEENRLEHIFNVMGAGLAAIDYDVDGWPDLYVAQGNQWRDPRPQLEYVDRLFRNRGGEYFDDWTKPAGLGDLAFSHGVTVGDYDQDGFPDIYLGNLGPNRLYHNNGDGTFDERAVAAGAAGDEWTTSSVFADFNGDGLPDLYVLNYTLRDETARRECGPSERHTACTPDVLTAENHRCYLNLGNGQFRDISAKSGIWGSAGKGLGVVAWDYAGDGRIGLFIANDTTPNFFFINHGVDADGVPQFRNEAVVRGVAYDMDGNVQASMGVAAGDVTGDGRIDLLITDFLGSANNLYSQGPEGFFEDRSRSFGVHEPSLTMLGFGCHFADLDGDGWNDLLVTNGHVDQKPYRGGGDRMPPQIYRNHQGFRFELVPAGQLGPFFQGSYLGRGLATWDWNRDGRTDAAISHLHAPIAVVTNRTVSALAPLVVRLIGRNGCREPTGASVAIVGANPPQVRLQTAGDGFLVTNERRHQFAIPQGTVHVHLEVRWPNGKTQQYENVPASAEVLLIEDRAEWLLLRQIEPLAVPPQ